MAYLGNRPATGENNAFRILDDISSHVVSFNGSSASVVSVSADTITIAGSEHRYITGQRVTYSKGGGTVITGLTDATAYYVIRDSATTIQLATTASNANNGVAVNLTGLGAGTAHTLTLAFDGTNTKFKPTYNDGSQNPIITRAAQLVLSLNGVIQQPIDSASPSVGFGIDGSGNIIFSTAPDANDDFWGHVHASNTVTFDISDNDIDNFTGDGSTANFNLSKTPPDNRNILVTLDGVVQYPSDNSNTRAYTLSENELQMVSAPASGVAIQVRHIGFAGPTAGGGGGVTGFYGRTGNVVLKSTDNPVIGNLTAVDGTFSGNVSIAKTLTYMDVAHIDAVGIITAQSGINLSGGNITLADRPDGNSQNLFFGTGAKAGIYHDGTNFTLINNTGHTYIGIGAANKDLMLYAQSTGNIILQRNTGHKYFEGVGSDGTAKIYHNTNEKIRTTTTGAVVTGILTATGTGSFATDIHVGENIAHLGDTDTKIVFTDNKIDFHANSNSRLYISQHGAYLQTGYPLAFLASTGPSPSIKSGGTNNQDLLLTTGNSNPTRIHIKSTGEVGIGTDNPASLLHTRSSTSNGLMVSTPLGDHYIWGIQAAGNLMNGSTAGDLGVRAQSGLSISANGGTSTQLRITSAGKVGINSTVPADLLTIGAGANTLAFGAKDTTRGNHIWQLLNNDNSGNAEFRMYKNSVSGTHEQAINFATSGDNNYIMYGNLGVGLNNPTQPVTIKRSSAGQAEFGYRFEYVDTNGPTQTSSAILVGSYGLKLKNYNSSRNFLFETGNVGIGTDAPDQTLELFKASGTNLVKVSTQANSTVGLEIEKTGATTQSWRIADGQTVNGALEFYDVTDSRRAMGIDGSGRVIIGPGNHAGGSQLVIKGGGTNAYSTLGMFSEHTNPSADTLLSQIRFGSNTTAVGADIRVYADAAWGSNDYPTRIGFYTTPDGSNGRQERLRIDSSGQITNSGIATSYVTHQFAANFAKLDLRGTNIANSNHYILSYGEGHVNDHEFHMVNTVGHLVFRTGTGTLTERVRINSAGEMSIGGQHADHAYDANSYGNPSLLIAGDDNADILTLMNDDPSPNNGDYASLGFRVAGQSTGSYAKAAIIAERSGGYNAIDLLFCCGQDADATRTTTSHRKMRIKADGRVSINTDDARLGQSNSASEFYKGHTKLGIKGSVAIGNTGSATADYSELAFYRMVGDTAGADGRITSTHNLGRVSWYGSSNDGSFPDRVWSIECIPNGGDWWAGSARRAKMSFKNQDAEQFVIASNGDTSVKSGKFSVASETDAMDYQILSGYKTFSASDTFVNLAYVGHSHSLQIQYMIVEGTNTALGGAHGECSFFTTYGSSSHIQNHSFRRYAMNGGRVNADPTFNYCNGGCGSHGGNYILQAKVGYSGSTHNFNIRYVIRGISTGNMYV